MAESKGDSRLNPPGTPTAELFSWPAETNFESMQGQFATQEYIQTLIRKVTASVLTRYPQSFQARTPLTSRPSASFQRAKAKLSGCLSTSGACFLSNSVWIPHLADTNGCPGGVVRQFLLELNQLAVSLDSVCTADTCAKMVATKDWEFLCAAHVQPKEVTTLFPQSAVSLTCVVSVLCHRLHHTHPQRIHSAP